jgi:hypothetical protein
VQPDPAGHASEHPSEDPIGLKNEQVVHGLIQIANVGSAQSAPSTAEVKATFGGMMKKLNSRVVAFWLKRRGKMQGHQFQIDKEPLPATPLVLGGREHQATVITLVDRILAAKQRDAEADVSSTEQEIDRLVYDLYGLTPEEIAIVEGTAK